MNKTSIDWPTLDYTWNPATGCLRNCSYCYARKIHNRFNKTSFEKIEYHYDRLNQPYTVKKSSTIFVGSMSDICYWDESFVNDIIHICKANYHHTFMFLTKDNFVYRKYNFPLNCMLGVTTTKITEEIISFKIKQTLNGCKNFLSFEPMLSKVECCEFGSINNFDLIIVGAMTGKGAIIPKPEWIESLKLLPQDKVYYKNNIKKYLE